MMPLPLTTGEYPDDWPEVVPQKVRGWKKRKLKPLLDLYGHYSTSTLKWPYRSSNGFSIRFFQPRSFRGMTSGQSSGYSPIVSGSGIIGLPSFCAAFTRLTWLQTIL